MTQLLLRNPPDVDEAHAEWGANCGPCALAAALGKCVADVRVAVSKPERQLELLGPSSSYRGFMGIRDMREALQALRVPIVRTWLRQPSRMLDDLDDTSGHSVLIILQWSGPWNDVPRAAATYRHFVVYRNGFVGPIGPKWIYDANFGWLPMSVWAEHIVPGLIPPRGDGAWLVDWAAELDPG